LDSILAQNRPLSANSVTTTNPVSGAAAKPGMVFMSGAPSVANTTVLLYDGRGFQVARL
jgi:hypothetical protein